MAADNANRPIPQAPRAGDTGGPVVLCPSCKLPMRQRETVPDALPHFECSECRTVYALYPYMPYRPIPAGENGEREANVIPCETPERHLQP